jgi:MFS family permease
LFAQTLTKRLFAVIMADRFGRRLPIAVEVVIGGIGFAVLAYYVSQLSFLIHNFVIGIAWGFLFVVYFAIQGEMAFPFASDKFYALGTIAPLVVYLGIASVPTAYFNVDISKLLPVIMVLLLPIIPLFLTKETLPGKKINERKMKEYIDKVGELLQEINK